MRFSDKPVSDNPGVTVYIYMYVYIFLFLLLRMHTHVEYVLSHRNRDLVALKITLINLRVTSILFNHTKQTIINKYINDEVIYNTKLVSFNRNLSQKALVS